MAKVIDLRTDAVTLPTEAMRRAMYRAEVGDDLYGEDPTVCLLEEKVAGLLGKPAAVLVLTATMGNIVSILSHTKRGDSILTDDKSHISINEAASLANLCGVVPRQVPSKLGVIEASAIPAAALTNKALHSPSSLVCLENTHNAAGGVCVSVKQTQEICTVAKSCGLSVHLDGARLFNASVALNVPALELVADVDSVTVGLTKGLGCPVGAIVVGARDFIEKVRYWRYVVGGAMSQAGIFAAAGVVALDTMVLRLAEDHMNARLLADRLSDFGLPVDLNSVQTNIVYTDVPHIFKDAAMFVQRLREEGILVNQAREGRVRFVTHYGISKADVEIAVSKINGILRSDRRETHSKPHDWSVAAKSP